MTQKTLVIETKVPDHQVFKGLNNWKSFFEAELTNRQQDLLPPFSRLIKLTSKIKLAAPIIKTSLKVSPVHINLDGQFQIIVSLPAKSDIRQLSQTVSKWSIEPDPISLL